MRSRIMWAVGALAIASIMAIPSASNAQYVFAGVGGSAGAGAAAYLTDGALEGGFFAFNGTSGELSTEFQGFGDVIEGCAGLYDSAESLLDTGCGSFTVVDVAPDLSSATVSGTIESTLIDFDSWDQSPSSLTITGTLTENGDLIPFAEAIEIADAGLFGGTPFAFVAAGGFVELDRIAAGTSSIASTALGTLSGPSDGVLFRGAGLGAGLTAIG